MGSALGGLVWSRTEGGRDFLYTGIKTWTFSKGRRLHAEIVIFLIEGVPGHLIEEQLLQGPNNMYKKGKAEGRA